MSKSEVDYKDALELTLISLGMKEDNLHGLYAPLVRRCPLRLDEEVPEQAREALKRNHTCACTDSTAVYIDTELARDMFERARDYVYEKRTGEERPDGGGDAEVSFSMVENDFCTILVHEYTHKLMKHVERGAKFVNANGDKNYPIFALACDIEANRGYGIDYDSDIYQIGVTDDSFPKCKGVVGLMNIYRTLRDNYGDEILKNYDQMKQNLGDDEDEDAGDDEGESKGEKSSQSSSFSPSTSTTSRDETTERQETVKRAMHDIDELRKEIEKKSSTMTEEELKKDAEYFDENADPTSDPTSALTSSGHSCGGYGTTEGDYNCNPTEFIRKNTDREYKQKLEKALDQVKAMVKVKGDPHKRARVSTYSRPSRKSSDGGLIRKGIKNDRLLAPRILVAMDSSGSMSSATVTPVASAIGTVAKMMGKTKGSFICEHDSIVKNVRPLSEWEEVVRGYYPDGDNNFDAVLREALNKKVEMVIDVGDGYCQFVDEELMKQAKARGIKWVDVQVCGTLYSLDGIISSDKKRFGDDYIGRTIIHASKEEV